MTKNQPKIPGGYYLKPRCLRNSDIAKKPPCYREIWDWLIEQANHCDNKGIPRGSCIRRIKDIQKGLSWYVGYRKMQYTKSQCENALKFLRKEGMIATTKTTRGMLIAIDKYWYYQDPKNYEQNNQRNNENNKQTTTPPNDKQELIRIKKNDKESITTESSSSETNLNYIMVLYQKKFPEQRKLYGMAGIVRARDYFDGILEGGHSLKDIEEAINKSTKPAPWDIIKPKKSYIFHPY